MRVDETNCCIVPLILSSLSCKHVEWSARYSVAVAIAE